MAMVKRILLQLIHQLLVMMKMIPLHQKKSKISFWYRLTVLTIGCKQAEEKAKQDINHPNTTEFNLNGPANSPKPEVIEEEEDKQPTTSAYELL